MHKTRKANGEGSVFKVAENKWVAKISMGTLPNGKPKVKQFSGKSETIVKKKLRDFKKSLDFCEKHIPNNDTLKFYILKWLREYQYQKLKPSSYDRLESTVKNHIVPSIGGLKINKITRDDVQLFINKLYRNQNLSYSSVKKVYVALNSCYKHALIDNIVTKNPCLGVALPSSKERTKQIFPLIGEEINKLKTEVKKTNPDGTPLYKYGYAYLLILNTGLRMGEALSLKWDDIDFDNNAISVNKNIVLSKKRSDNGDVIGGYELLTQNQPKTSSGHRLIPINHSARKALLELHRGNDTPYVIVNKNNNTVLPGNFERSFRTILKNAKITNDYGIHALRHTFASLLFAKGVDIKVVSELLGHSTVKITYDTYVHIFTQDIQHVTNLLDDITKD